MSKISPIADDQAVRPLERPADEVLADDVVLAAKRIGIGRATAYLEIRSGRLRSFTIGRRRLISREAQREYILAREAETVREISA